MGKLWGYILTSLFKLNRTQQNMDDQIKLCNFQGIDWHKYNLARTHEKRMFYELLNELSKLIPDLPKSNGRPPIPLKDLFFMSALKIYCNFSLRKIHHDLREAEACGYIKKAGHFNRVSDFFNSSCTYNLLSKFLTISAMPLKQLEDDFSMDASGFGSSQYERWMRIRFVKPKTEWRNYLKGHILIGTRTNVICSAEITYGNLNDGKQAPLLLQQANGNFDMKRVSADKGYASFKIFQLIDSIGATPFIPFKENITKENKDAPKIWNRMFRYFQKNKDSFLKFYHRRSNVESTFAMIKMRLGEFLKCKNYESQRNELMMKFIVHNICCLISEIFENKVHIDFKECIRKYVEPKPIKIKPEPENPLKGIGRPLILPDDFSE